LKDAQISRLHSAWTDHSLLHISFSVGQAPTGPGLWRANPAYASHLVLQQQIEDKVQKTLDRLNTDSVMSPEDKWDQIKIATKKVIRNYSYDYVNWLQKTIKHLELTRNRILRGNPSLALRIQLLGPLDQQLGQLQQELAAIYAVIKKI
jgi:hypothetical protein